MKRIKRVYVCDHDGPKYKGSGMVEMVDMGYFVEQTPSCLCTGEPKPMKLKEKKVYDPDNTLH